MEYCVRVTNRLGNKRRNNDYFVAFFVFFAMANTNVVVFSDMAVRNVLSCDVQIIRRENKPVRNRCRLVRASFRRPERIRRQRFRHLLCAKTDVEFYFRREHRQLTASSIIVFSTFIISPGEDEWCKFFSVLQINSLLCIPVLVSTAVIFKLQLNSLKKS